MANDWFQFKAFKVEQQGAAFKVGTDGCLLGAWVELSKARRILDIGTGSGLIALMLAQRSEADIQAIEIDASSAFQAKANFLASQWKDRLEVSHVSLQEFSGQTNHQYDVIVSNPPFFKNNTPNPESRSAIARHEKGLSLHELFNCALELTHASGDLAFVIPFERKTEACELADQGGWFHYRSLAIQPTSDKQANRICMHFSKENRPDKSSEQLIIYDSEGQYSEGFKSLLAPFYLHL